MPTTRFQPSFAAGVLGPGLHGRIDVAKYDVGLKVGKNVFIHAHGGVSNRPGTEFIGEVMDSSKVHRLIPFTRDDDENYVMVMGDQEMKIIDNGAYLETSPGVDYNPTTPFASSILFELDYVQSIDVMYFAHSSMVPQKMSRTAETTWTYADINVDPTLTAPTSVTVTPSSSGSNTYSYKISPVTDGVEGFPSAAGSNASCANLSVSGNSNEISWTGSGADEYSIYRERNGVYGYIGFTDATSFTDDNISPDLSTTPIEASGMFGSANNYPSHVTLFQQRLVFANSPNQPETIWMSRVGDFENFTKSRILKDDDRIELDITGSSVNRIRHLTQLRELMVFTSAGEFTVTGPNGVMLATNPIQTQYGYSGSAGVRPLVVEDTLLFVDRTGRGVRDLRYAFDQDGYTGNDLTIFARHFFEGKEIIEWAFQKNPYSVIWVCLDDGTLLSFTYKREHQVWAWTEHDVSGSVESITAIPEGNEDAVYMIVNRTINGSTKRYVERLHTRQFPSVTDPDCFFVDCGITYNSTATTTITGLSHLEGETVVALADGAVVEGITVSSGQVTLPAEASVVNIGLPYQAEIETLPPPIDLEGVGSARGRPHKASAIYVQLEDTRGIKIGPSSREMATLFFITDDLSEARPLYTGMERLQLHPDWNREGTIVVQQDNPLPMTILGISPEYSVGRS